MEVHKQKSVAYQLQNGNGGDIVQKDHNPQRISNPEVDLSNHQLVSIPPYIYDHPRVQTLILSYNAICEIPKAIGSLRQLRKLCVNSNRLTHIAENLCNCTKLEHLSLASNRLSLLPAKIGSLSSLSFLSIAHNEFESIPYEIGMLEKLTDLDLKGNRLWYLPFSVENLRQLCKLDLSNNNFEHLPMPVCHIASLVSLSVHGNQLLSLAPVFQQLRNLHELNLANNRMTKIPPAVCKLPKLRYLNVGLNQIADIPIDIANLTKLKVLHIPGNSLRTFPNTLINLRYLNLAQNQIVNFSVAGMKKLRYLNVDGNHLENVPLGLYNLPHLEHLKLNNNKITFLSQDIALLTHLKTLDIGNNCLTSLPHVVSELQNLDYFNVTGNDINQRFMANRVEPKARKKNDSSWIRQKIQEHKKDKSSLVSATLRPNHSEYIGENSRHWHYDTTGKQRRSVEAMGVLRRRKSPPYESTDEKVLDWQQEVSRREGRRYEEPQSSDTDFRLLGVCSEIESLLSRQLFTPVFSGTETLPKNFRKKNIVKTPNGLWRLSDGDTTSMQTCDSSLMFTPRKPQQHYVRNSRPKHRKQVAHRRNSDPDLRVVSGGDSGGFGNINRRGMRRRSRTMENLSVPRDRKVVSGTPAIHTQTDHFTVTRNGGSFLSASDPRVKLTIPQNAFMKTHKIVMQVVKMFAETLVAAQEHVVSTHNILSISDVVLFRNAGDIEVNHSIVVTIPLPYRARRGHIHVLTVTGDDTCVPYTGNYTERNGHAKLSMWSLSGKTAVATKSKCPYKACHCVEQLLRYTCT